MSGLLMGWALYSQLPTEEKFALVVMSDSGSEDEYRPGRGLVSVDIPHLVQRTGSSIPRITKVIEKLKRRGILIPNGATQGRDHDLVMSKRFLQVDAPDYIVALCGDAQVAR